MAWYNSIGDFTSSMRGGSLINNVMSSIGIGNDTIADSPIGSFLGMAQNKESKRQFDESMAWSKYQFNNAHQAEVADLEKAGLNPILSSNHSGASPVGLPSPTAHMDNGSAGLGFITNILSNVANLKNAKANLTTANAVDKKAQAESDFIDMQKRILGYSENYSKLKGESAAQYIQMELNKDPRNTIKAIVHGIGDLINEFANSTTGKSVENNSSGIYNFLDLFNDKQVRNVIDTISLPARIKKELGGILNLIRILSYDGDPNVPFKELKVYN